MTVFLLTGEVTGLPAPSEGPAAGRVCFGRPLVYGLLGALLVSTNLMLAIGDAIPWMSPTVGIGTILGVPAFLLYGANPARLARGSERLAISVVLALGLLMIAGLVANALGPPVGFQNPLGPGGAVATVDVAILGLAVWAWPRHPRSYSVPLIRLGWCAGATILGGITAVAVAVFGATRLNNGLGGRVTLIALLLVLATFAGLALWRNQIQPGAIAGTIYLLATALLLMTSLRGWYVTGHDVQREFQVFELTRSLGRWEIARYDDGYNACISITILPTLFARWTGVSSPYVFKLFFQLLFGLCPVLVYHLARRFVSGGLALVASIYFVAFPTFLQDMPFLNRQEIALLFLTAGLLCLFNPHVELPRRKLWFCILALGMVLSHYSTTYEAIAVLLVAAALRWAVPLLWSLTGAIAPRALHLVETRWIWAVLLAGGIGLSQLVDVRIAVAATLNAMMVCAVAPSSAEAARDHGVPRRQAWLRRRTRSSALGVGAIAFVIVASAVWVGPLTGTSGGVVKTVASSLAGLSGRQPGSKSSDTSYSLFSGAKPSPARLLEKYRQDPPGLSGDAATRYDPTTVARYATPIVEPPPLPATSLGAALAETSGVSLPRLNGLVRQGSAGALQLFIVLGLFGCVFARRRRVAASADLLYLGAANLVVLGLQVALPGLSVDYGLLRAFQQSLLVLDVFLVVGSLALVPHRFARWQGAVAATVALCFLASSTGVVTQLLGGYGAQLHLNNAGEYYDIYYVHPEELAAGRWIRDNIDVRPGASLQSSVQSDSFTFPALQIIEVPAKGNDIFPTLVRRDSYVFLGYTNVQKRESTVSYSGDLITYRYPVDFLDAGKDLLYSTAGSRVYR